MKLTLLILIGFLLSSCMSSPVASETVKADVQSYASPTGQVSQVKTQNNFWH